MPNGTICIICSVQLPLRIQELACSFNKGLLAGSDDDEGEEPTADDDDDDDDNDDRGNSDGDSNDEPVTKVQKLLLRAKECLHHLPPADLFKYRNKNLKPATSSNPVSTSVNVHTGHMCSMCGKVCKTKGGLTQHEETHR